VIDLYHIKGWPKAKISREENILRSSVRDIIDRGEEDKTILRTAGPQRGKYYAISTEKVLEIERDIDSSWGKSSITSEEIIDYYDLDCHPKTLLNAFRRVGVGHFWAA
jgi:hypothetical protein